MSFSQDILIFFFNHGIQNMSQRLAGKDMYMLGAFLILTFNDIRNIRISLFCFAQAFK